VNRPLGERRRRQKPEIARVVRVERHCFLKVLAGDRRVVGDRRGDDFVAGALGKTPDVQPPDVRRGDGIARILEVRRGFGIQYGRDVIVLSAVKDLPELRIGFDRRLGALGRRLLRRRRGDRHVSASDERDAREQGGADDASFHSIDHLAATIARADATIACLHSRRRRMARKRCIGPTRSRRRDALGASPPMAGARRIA